MDQVTPESEVLPDANASPEVVAPDGDKPKGSEADPSPAAAESEKKPEKTGAEIRIDELTRRLREAERRNDRLLKLAEERTTRVPEPAPQPKPEPARTLKDFNFDEGAFTAYLEERLAQTADRVVETKLTEKEQKIAEAKRNAGYFSRAAEFAKTAEDYYDVAGSAPITETIVELVKELEEAPLVAYHLGNNHGLAEELSNLSERAAAIRLGKLEDKLVAEREKLKAKTVSQAPPPTPKIEGTQPGIAVKASSPESDELSADDWLKRRNKELRKG